MELDKIRHDPKAYFYHETDPARRTRGEYRATQYSDVCGSVDELKRVLAEEPQRVGQDRQYLLSLLDDALYMTRRMQTRQQQYFEFGRQMAALARDILDVVQQSTEPAEAGAGALRDLFGADENCATTHLDRLNELAEQVRDVANNQEGRLREQKELSIRMLRAYEAIKGRRNWSEEEGEEQ